MEDDIKSILCADPELERQIRCFRYGEHSDVPRFQQVEQKAVGRQRNLGLGECAKLFAYMFQRCSSGKSRSYMQIISHDTLR
jgi:hypothetical protein